MIEPDSGQASARSRVVGTAAPLMRDFVNTDAIIPATYMRRLTKSGYGDVLFEPWRGMPGFVLDDRRYAGSSILLAGEAFGSGSSREHAPWALRDGGFRAIVAVSFADIFAQNCSIVGLATAALPRDRLEALSRLVVADPTLEVTVDIEAEEVRADGFAEHFPIEPYVRRRLLSGHDLVGSTLTHLEAIEEFERGRHRWLPTTVRVAE